MYGMLKQTLGLQCSVILNGNMLKQPLQTFYSLHGRLERFEFIISFGALKLWICDPAVLIQ
jgi:hypothetical protein